MNDGGLIFCIGLHTILVVYYSIAYVQSHWNGLRTEGRRFRFMITDLYAGLLLLLPWLWGAVRFAQFTYGYGGTRKEWTLLLLGAWGLIVVLATLLAGWIVGILHNDIAQMDLKEKAWVSMLNIVANQLQALLCLAVGSIVFALAMIFVVSR